MKHFAAISLVGLAGLALAATPSFATTLTAGGSVTPGLEAGTFSSLATTGPEAYSFGAGNIDTGTFQESVGTSSVNPYGSNDLTFIFQVNVTGGDIASVSTGNFDSALTDVGNGLGGTTAPTTATRSGDGNAITFFFDPNILAPGMSDIMIINTNQTTYIPSTAGLEDSGSQQVDGYGLGSPVPEPSSLALMGTGLVALGAGMRRKFVGR